MDNINQPMTGSPMPVTGPSSLNGGQQVGYPDGWLNGDAAAAASPPIPAAQPQITKQRSQTNEDMLIKLITNTIEPQELGGAGRAGHHRLLPADHVAGHQPDAGHPGADPADLLEALRRLQDQEVAVEVRFITIAEDFFERIGVNFNMNILNKSDQHSISRS